MLIAARSGALADATLASLDRYLLFDWRRLFAVYVAHPDLVQVSKTAYWTFVPQMMFIPAIIAITCGGPRTWR